MTNLLRAIQCIVKNQISGSLDLYKERNIINNNGFSLEELIKDTFADTLAEENKGIRVQRHSEVFSYLGNQNNPPDIIIKQGDAIEVKKIKSFTAGIHLNSSYPRSKLITDDPMILASCQSVDGENWESKDLIYVIGVVQDNKLKRLWLIVGDCLAADYQTYKRIRDKIVAGIEKLRDVEFSKNKELYRLNKLDPLGSAYSQLIGAWGISNPINIYNYLDIDYNEKANLQVIAIMTAGKYLSFPQSDLEEIAKMVIEITNLEIRDIQIESPNNSTNLIDAKLITYQN